MDRRINNLRDGCLETMIGNLYAGKLMFDIHPKIAYNLADQDFSRVLTLHQDFKRKDLMKEGNIPYSITYRIAYALSNTHHSNLFLRKEYIEIPRIFKKFAKVMTLDPIRIPRIGGVDIVIKDHLVLERTLSTRTEFSSRMSFSKDRITGYRGKEKEQPVIGRYEGMLEVVGHEILVTGSGICTTKPGVFPKESMETLPVIAGRDFSQKILILNKGIREAKIIIGGAFGTHPGLGQQGLIDSDSFYKESEEEIKNLKEALQEIKSLDISEERKLSLENVKRLIQRNFSENPLAWWDRNKIEATLKVKEECKYEHLKENLEEFDRQFGRLNAQVAGQVQRANLDTVQTAIRSSLVASTVLWNDLREPIRKASPSGMTNELREHDPKHAFRVQGSRPVVADSSIACTRPSSDSGETATIEPRRVQTSDDSSQPNTFGAKEGEISLRPMTDTSKRPDMVVFNKIKVATGETPLVSAISEDDISTRRAWDYGIEFAESMFEKKRMLIWENKLPATEATRMKTCNMLHVGQWHNHVCPCCEKQEKFLFGTKIRVTQKKPKPSQDKGKRKNFYKTK
ncbi:UNVERIFIED_CONTAM: movement protein [Sesamum radiatum]|uniref:Movement protein n=1 Tax=Sesamum radiatum TaxID=300843 RepID=A0AAW2R1R8_SESRA